MKSVDESYHVLEASLQLSRFMNTAGTIPTN